MNKLLALVLLSGLFQPAISSAATSCGDLFALYTQPSEMRVGEDYESKRATQEVIAQIQDKSWFFRTQEKYSVTSKSTGYVKGREATADAYAVSLIERTQRSGNNERGNRTLTRQMIALLDLGMDVNSRPRGTAQTLLQRAVDVDSTLSVLLMKRGAKLLQPIETFRDVLGASSLSVARDMAENYEFGNQAGEAIKTAFSAGQIELGDILVKRYGKRKVKDLDALRNEAIKRNRVEADLRRPPRIGI